MVSFSRLKTPSRAWNPPPDLTVSQWADKERKLSSEASAEPGQWNTDRAPYQREILDAVNDPLVEGVVVMSSAQVGKTELLLNLIGYYIDFDPAPILVLQPTVEMGQAFSKDRLAPMIRDTNSLKTKVADSKARDKANTIMHKSFPGGHITIAGANSAASLASRPIRILLADEIDRYPASAGAEGDPLNLAKKRTTTFWNKKMVAVSTPTIKGVSRIEDAYEDSTQERYCLPCPSCDELQPLRWRNIIFEEVGHACEECGSIHSQNEWLSGEGTWIANNEHSKTRGFHLNELVSPWRRWEQIIDDFHQARKSPETLKTFVNTSLGETWEEEGESIEHSTLHKRREHYTQQVPAAACVLTAAVDVQDDRLEIGVEAWGDGEENWKVDFNILRGDPARPDLWQKLDDALSTRYKHESGVELSISCVTIDSGGHYTQQVYKYVKARESRRIYAIKGRGGEGVPIVGRPSKSNIGKVSLFSIGVDTAKETIYARLKNTEPGAGYVHFPVEPMFDEEYFEQLTAEKCVTKFVKGRPRREWAKKRSRNEALDIAVYNLAALYILNPNFRRLAQRLHTEPEIKEEPKPRRSTQRPKRRRIKKKNWATDI